MFAVVGFRRVPHRERPQVPPHCQGGHLHVLDWQDGLARHVEHDTAEGMILVVACVTSEVLVHELARSGVQLQDAVQWGHLQLLRPSACSVGEWVGVQGRRPL